MSHSVKRFDGKNPELKKEFDKTEPVIISGPENIASFVSEKRLGGKPKISFLMLSRRNQVIGNLITEFDSYEGNEEALAEQMVKLGVRHGASSVVPYGKEMQRGPVKKLSQLVKELSGKNLTVLDALCIENGLSYESAQNNFLLEGEAAYGDKGMIKEVNPTPKEISENEVFAIIDMMKSCAKEAPKIELNEINWKPKVVTPIGMVKMGEHQKEKMFKKGRSEQYGMVLETLKDPDIILEEKDKDNYQKHERPSSYLFIKTFQKEDGTKYVYFENVTVSKEGLEISISSHIIREKQLREKMKNSRMLYKATALDESANSSAEHPAEYVGSHSSEGKGSENSADSQVNEDKTSGEAKEKRVEELAEEGDILYRDGEDEIAEVYSRFNEDLERFERGELDEKFRFELGMPSEYLLSAGFPNLPISMRQSLLKKKSQQSNHPFEPSDVRDMVSAIQKPLAIFKYNKDNVRNLIIALEKDGKHFLVGITLGFKRDGLEINSISGLFPKQDHEWIKWIQDGLAMRIDQKGKVLELIESLRINPAEANRIGLDLDNIAKVVKNFENPSIVDKKSVDTEEEGVLYRIDSDFLKDVNKYVEEYGSAPIEIVTGPAGIRMLELPEEVKEGLIKVEADTRISAIYNPFDKKYISLQTGRAMRISRAACCMRTSMRQLMP